MRLVVHDLRRCRTQPRQKRRSARVAHRVLDIRSVEAYSLGGEACRDWATSRSHVRTPRSQLRSSAMMNKTFGLLEAWPGNEVAETVAANHQVRMAIVFCRCMATALATASILSPTGHDVVSQKVNRVWAAHGTSHKLIPKTSPAARAVELSVNKGRCMPRLCIGLLLLLPATARPRRGPIRSLFSATMATPSAGRAFRQLRPVLEGAALITLHRRGDVA